MRVPKILVATLKIAASFPLHLAAAFLATVISDLLLTVQPMFLRTFIDLSQNHVDVRKLWIFPILMAAAAVLAYAYEFISVAIRYFLKRRIAQLIEEVYIDYGDKQRPEIVRLSLGKGIDHLAELTMSVSVEFLMYATRIGLILACLALDQVKLALATFVILLVSGVVSWITTQRGSRIIRTMELIRSQSITLAMKGSPSAKRHLTRLYELDWVQFLLKALNFFLSFVVFRVLPVSVLALYLFGSGVTLGALTSTFLYFSMLRGPYNELVKLLQESMAALSEASLFADSLEQGLWLHGILDSLPVGLIWSRESGGGTPLSAVSEAPPAREYFDDLGDSPEGAPVKASNLRTLAERSKSASICVHSQDDLMFRHAHFFAPRQAKVRTILPILRTAVAAGAIK
jgi:ABC-type multidrug transport system fused ATPase/permease subunit